MGRSPEIQQEVNIDPRIKPLCNEAVKIAVHYQLFRRIGLEDREERGLASLFLAERLVRGKLYTVDKFLKDPSMLILERIPPFGLVHDMLQNWRDKKQEALRTIVECEEYAKQLLGGDGNKKGRISSIERAINDISARVNRTLSPYDYPYFSPTEEMLSSWANRWRPELSSEK